VRERRKEEKGREGKVRERRRKGRKGLREGGKEGRARYMFTYK
jgi:hypothetical protein